MTSPPPRARRVLDSAPMRRIGQSHGKALLVRCFCYRLALFAPACDKPGCLAAGVGCEYLTACWPLMDADWPPVSDTRGSRSETVPERAPLVGVTIVVQEGPLPCPATLRRNDLHPLIPSLPFDTVLFPIGKGDNLWRGISSWSTGSAILTTSPRRTSRAA